ncbi:flavin-containing monooxygenase [Williamsia deligens]|uniref:Flavin-containing monooxygenase n=1 Tax=Williamsia deligens TaxID=321325 RepID=A0ABW3GAF1_9NOCA|nr:NAD(P)/FAD-dependent oxidoreductase [Williamsia deligens]
MSTQPRVAIIGAGFGGLCVALRLAARGHHDFVVFEQADDVGGTWYANTYPGAACDAPSHIYSYSFARTVSWSRRFAPGPEIHAYLRRCVDDAGIADRIRLSTPVRSAAWVDGRWQIALADGTTDVADVLVPALGQLSVPKVPGWAQPEALAAAGFTGEVVHTARWRDDVDLTGRRVAVVGTGASAVQVVPEIVGDAAHVTVFQRSAPYVMARPDAEYGARRRRMPGYTAVARASIWAVFELFTLSFWRWPASMAVVRRLFLRQLRSAVPDPALRAVLTPDHEIGCKRITVSSDWYPALQRDDVDLVTDRISGVAASGIVAGDTTHPADVIVLATGFATTEFCSTVDIRGRNGLSPAEAWRDGAAAHLGMSVPGFPNLFLVYGPNTNLGAGSIVYMLETQTAHILDAVAAITATGSGLEVRRSAYDGFRRAVRAAEGRTVWAGCRNWYRDDHGHDIHNWQWSMWSYRRRAGRMRPADYRAVTVT